MNKIKKFNANTIVSIEYTPRVRVKELQYKPEHLKFYLFGLYTKKIPPGYHYKDRYLGTAFFTEEEFVNKEFFGQEVIIDNKTIYYLYRIHVTFVNNESHTYTFNNEHEALGKLKELSVLIPQGITVKIN